MSNKFKQFRMAINEASKADNAIVFAFGRFQPLTSGHEKLVRTLIETAKRAGADHRLYTSQSFDSKRNPIDYNTKIKFLKSAFPKAHVTKDASIRNPFDVLDKVIAEGYRHIIMVAGDDRVMSFETQVRNFLSKYHPEVRKFEVISAGKRNEKAIDVTGMSGSKMRQFALEGDFQAFLSGVPSSMSDSDARKMYQAIRDGLLVKESFDGPREYKLWINTRKNKKIIVGGQYHHTTHVLEFPERYPEIDVEGGLASGRYKQSDDASYEPELVKDLQELGYVRAWYDSSPFPTAPFLLLHGSDDRYTRKALEFLANKNFIDFDSPKYKHTKIEIGHSKDSLASFNTFYTEYWEEYIKRGLKYVVNREPKETFEAYESKKEPPRIEAQDKKFKSIRKFVQEHKDIYYERYGEGWEIVLEAVARQEVK